MTLRQQIIWDFRERIKMCNEVPRELRNALERSDRFPVFVDNLVAEINKFPKRIKIDRMKLKSLVYSMTDIYWRALKAKHDKDYASEIARMAAAAKPAFELDNQGNGEVKDLGVIIKDG